MATLSKPVAIGLFAGLFLSIAANAWFVIALLDAAITLDYGRQQILYLDKEILVAIAAVDAGWRGRTEAEVEQFMQQVDERGDLDRHHEWGIVIGELRFIMEDGRVSRVLPLNNHEQDRDQ